VRPRGPGNEDGSVPTILLTPAYKQSKFDPKLYCICKRILIKRACTVKNSILNYKFLSCYSIGFFKTSISFTKLSPLSTGY
jgi:hypothetical protein